MSRESIYRADELERGETRRIYNAVYTLRIGVCLCRHEASSTEASELGTRGGAFQWRKVWTH